MLQRPNLQKINEKQKVLEIKKMKLLEKAIPSQEATKTKAGASGNSESGVPRKKAKNNFLTIVPLTSAPRLLMVFKCVYTICALPE